MLDLFAFCEVKIGGKKTNALIEALSRGLEPIVDYAFNDGFISIRAVLKNTNPFEIENEPAPFNVSYFKNHISNHKFMRKLYYYLIDLLQLCDFSEILTSYVKHGPPQTVASVFDFVLNDQKFKSLFMTSLIF